jgi:hypothetical protein
VQAAGGGRGKRLLYWFRTPPGVRVGRAPIDETAIRLLEQHNPDVEFDWTRILKAPPAGEGQGRRDARDTRDRDQRGRREPRSAQRPRSGGGPPVAQPPARPRSVDARPPAADHQAQAADQAEQQIQAADHAEHADQQTRAADHAEQETQAAEHADHAEQQTQAAEHAEHADQQTRAAEHADHADQQTRAAEYAEHAESQTEVGDYAVVPVDPADLINEMLEAPDLRSDDVGSASYVRLGTEGLVRLRARYAEVMARIAEQPLEEPAREELKLRAERLNPDAWVTADEVTAALEQYETVFEGLRGIVGRHPRRRQRGRR